MSKKAEKPKPVSVYVRCRPRNAAEKAAGSHNVVDCTKKEVIVRHNNHNLSKKYTFDHVYGPDSTQVDVYKGVAASTIEEVLKGYNCTVFAYGQTGTGKTYTMEGDRNEASGIPWDKDPKIGLIPRCMAHMFDRLNSQASDFSVRVSMLELYNEELFDLLSAADSNTRLRLFEDSTRKVTGSRGIGSVVIQGLEEVQVMSKDEVYTLMERAMQKRQTASTLLNKQSSRSHVVFTVTVHIKTVSQDEIGECEEEVFKMGKFNLVDLAGSENIGRSGALKDRAREAGSINQSLLTLGRVITALVDRAPHVPYRESKLTRLLQDSLGGKTQTSIVATISPAQCNLEETISTLDYANRAKNILNKPEINQRSSKKALIKEYTVEIEKLRKELQMNRDKCGVYLDAEKYNEMETRIRSQNDIIKDKEEELGALIEARSKISGLFGDSIRQIDGLHQKIDRKEAVEVQNKALINNFIQSTKSQYAMFGEFVSQRRSQLTECSSAIDRLLAESRERQNAARDRTVSSIAQLMETVVAGLDTAVQQRDQHHETWLNSFFTSDLLPALGALKAQVEGAQRESDETLRGFLGAVQRDHETSHGELESIEKAMSYMVSATENKLDHLVEHLEVKQKKIKSNQKEREELLQSSLQEQQTAIQRLIAQSQAQAEMQAQTQAELHSLLITSQDKFVNIQDFGIKYDDQMARFDKETHASSAEIVESVKHSTQMVVVSPLKTLREGNEARAALISGVEREVGRSSARLAGIADTCTRLEGSLVSAEQERRKAFAGSREETATNHRTLVGADKPGQAHLRAIYERRFEHDSLTVEQCVAAEKSISALNKETSQLFELSEVAYEQSRGLIKDADQSLLHLGKHVREDLSTGTTPKRARLNRLKMQQSSDFKLDMIESDDENSNPNSNKNSILDMSY